MYVYHYEKELLRKIHIKNRLSIDECDFNWRWRYEELDKVSRAKMLFYFWKHPRSFYEQTRLEKELL